MNLEKFVKKNKVVVLAGSGSSIDLLPKQVLQKNMVISLNYTFLYVPESNKNHIVFCSDFAADEIREGFKKHCSYIPENIYSKYDFNQVAQYTISKNLTTISSASNSFFRGLDLAYKLQPEVILIIGVDQRMPDAKKIQELPFYRINYDDKNLDEIFKKDLLEYQKAKKQMELEGIKVINLSPCSRLPQDMTIEEYIKCHY